MMRGRRFAGRHDRARAPGRGVGRRQRSRGFGVLRAWASSVAWASTSRRSNSQGGDDFAAIVLAGELASEAVCTKDTYLAAHYSQLRGRRA